MSDHQKVLIVDFGSQVTQLIARRLREASVYCEIHPYAKADLVFVDAPCTGSGTWRRHPEGAWRLKADEVERLRALQLRILGQAAQLVKPGGRLAYVTCSILSRENEAVTDAFEAGRSEFRPVPVSELLAASPDLTDEARGRLGALASGARLRLSPGSSGTDGFFFCAYERIS